MSAKASEWTFDTVNNCLVGIDPGESLPAYVEHWSTDGDRLGGHFEGVSCDICEAQAAADFMAAFDAIFSPKEKASARLIADVEALIARYPKEGT